MKQAVITLSIPANRPTAVVSLPNHRKFADQIGAKHLIINKRKRRDAPSVMFEKIQSFEIGKKYDKIFYLDDDTLILKGIFDYLDQCPVGTGQFWCNVHPRDLLEKFTAYPNYFHKIYSDIRQVMGNEHHVFASMGFWITDSQSCLSVLENYRDVAWVADPAGGDMTWMNLVIQRSKIEIRDLPPLLHVGGGFAVYHQYTKEDVLARGGIIHYAGDTFLSGLSKAGAMRRDASHPNVL